MAALQGVIVALIVIVCATYSAWRLTSARFHLRVIDLLGVFGDGGARPNGWVGRLRNRELSKLGGSCGACSANVKVKVHGPDPTRTPGAPRR
jgi:hypothetical protein